MLSVGRRETFRFTPARPSPGCARSQTFDASTHSGLEKPSAVEFQEVFHRLGPSVVSAGFAVRAAQGSELTDSTIPRGLGRAVLGGSAIPYAAAVEVAGVQKGAAVLRDSRR